MFFRTKPFVRFFVAASFLAAAAFFASCSKDNPAQPPPGPTPVVDAVNKDTVAPGDTLLLTGSNFALPASSNRVYFNNSVGSAVPFRSTGDSLEVVVPDNANSGPMHVTSLGVRSNDTLLEVQRAVGQGWIVGETNFSLKLPVVSGSERYLVIPYSAQGGGLANFSYTVTPSGAGAYPAPERVSTAPAVASFAELWEETIRESALEHLRAHPHPRPFETSPSRGAPAQARVFNVLNCGCDATCDPACSVSNASNFEQVSADLKYSGTNVLIYADVNQPTGSYTQADYDGFGMQFDNALFPVDTTAFGPPTDIDGNGKVIILFSPVVNQITPPNTWTKSGFVSGFFLINDLAPGNFPAGTSNSGEVFYGIVPDPNNEYGNAFTRNALLSVMPGTLAHEFEHMISFGYRFHTLGGGTSLGYLQVTWLEEGMAHIAEDLNGMDSQNIARANLYLAKPGQTSLMDPDDAEYGLRMRGGIFLMLRYLGDRFGDDIYREFVETACVGQGCFGAVVGVDFFQLVGDFLATLYLSNRGITQNPKYNYTSLNMQTDLNTLPVTTQSFAAGAIGGSVRNASGKHYVLTNGTAPAVQLDAVGSANSRLRLQIVRVQ